MTIISTEDSCKKEITDTSALKIRTREKEIKHINQKFFFYFFHFQVLSGSLLKINRPGIHSFLLRMNWWGEKKKKKKREAHTFSYFIETSCSGSPHFFWLKLFIHILK